MKPHFSPRMLAQAIGVSESSVKRWVDSGRISTMLTAGGHRRIPRAEALRFVREARSALIRPEVLGLEVASKPEDPPGERLCRLLSEGRQDQAVALLLWLYASGTELPQILDGPVRDAMHRLGELWCDRSDRGIYLEHRATQICLRAVHELGSALPPAEAGAGLALGGAPDGDPYLLPSLCAATVLAEIGFRTTNLGPNTPLDAFVRAIEEQRPAMIWISITSARSAKSIRTWVSGLTGAIAETGAILMLGGRESDSIPVDLTGSIFRGSSMVELAAYGRGFADRLQT